MLHEISRRLAANQVPIAHERKFSRVVAELMNLIAETKTRGGGSGERQPGEGGARPRMLLALAPDNAHEIGPICYAMLLAEHGVSVELDTGREPLRLLEYLLEDQGFVGVGLSVALPAQLEGARALAGAIRDGLPGMVTALGGYVTKAEEGGGALPEFDWVADPRSSNADARGLAELLRERQRAKVAFALARASSAGRSDQQG
ncbi:hypothetical protein G6O69_30100 [Pseudenhygromyxa sp. WMMC2535]|uniref:hypothetical protein n=1 Tax=Pseudenhygromyxa sp. WMMC2535 TaxID=2712867 RepID=UPI00155470A7|nr:hypothetical protein [Pseudenhygromyxa sp. WMMC2535]NVB42114.1 hypothetical protein [Pseudenhygromyxa sp. WMMC2535]